MPGAETIASRLARVQERIATAARRVGREPESVVLVGATKTVDVARISAAYAAGLRDFGENYVQEAQAKLADPALGVPEARWHLIGHLQTNKVKTAVGLFAIIQSLDSLRLAGALARHAASAGCRPMVLVEVDYTGLPDRTGVSPEGAEPLVEGLLGWSALDVAGLMTVPAPGLGVEETRGVYRRLRTLRDTLEMRFPAFSWHHLSMGMTDDFELAIEEGATIVRIGRAIFGERP
jgi:pyridoxal phosphate enzyme (YggS family)